jgi:hypothetical protein
MSTFKCKCHFCGKELVRKTQTKQVKYHFCNTHCKAEYQRTLKPVTKEWLIDHYVNQNLDCTQISYIVKRDPKSVWNWLKDFNIETRNRGDNYKNNLTPGRPVGYKHKLETKIKMREIAIADKRVPFNPQVGPYCKGKKGADTTNWKGGITPERQAFYSSIEWSNAVKEIWKRDNAICQKCKKSYKIKEKRIPFHIHHITSFKIKELRTDVNNLILLCKDCHLWVHSKLNKNKEFIK